MSVNKELLIVTLNKVVEESKKPPSKSRWRQTRYISHKSCGTAYCFAGWVCVLSGLKPSNRFDYGNFSDGEYIYDKAVGLLGITENQADELFHAWNTIDDLSRVTKEIVGDEA